MKLPKKMYAVESVLKGHPDKICDQISDGLLDTYLAEDMDSHVAIECLGTNDILVVAGEINSKAYVDVEQKCRELYANITGFTNLNVINRLSQQSHQLVDAVKFGGAGDQGIMYGYACSNEKFNYLPYGYWLVNTLAKRLDKLREDTCAFLPDGKIQAIISDERILQITINVQHKEKANMGYISELIRKTALFDIGMSNVSINPDEGFVRGGFDNDTGLTGRKIIIDTYGGLAPHGGGAFSGKDPSKVDRSAAYMCRFVAKNLVANGIAQECTVSVAYNFGEEKPAMIHVLVDNQESNRINDMVQHHFDFRPQAIIERLNLKTCRYLPTATYGHFSDPSYTWEQVINV